MKNENRRHTIWFDNFKSMYQDPEVTLIQITIVFNRLLCKSSALLICFYERFPHF